MQITLNQDEIELAITAYVRSQISIQDTQEISIDLRAGRGETGFSATLDIRQASAPGVKKTAVKPATPAPAAAAAAPTPFRKPAVVAAPPEEEASEPVPAEEEPTAGISTGESREPVEEEPRVADEPVEVEAPKPAAARTSIFSKVSG